MILSSWERYLHEPDAIKTYAQTSLCGIVTWYYNTSPHVESQQPPPQGLEFPVSADGPKSPSRVTCIEASDANGTPMTQLLVTQRDPATVVADSDCLSVRLDAPD
ncbi:unnamed protein product [Mesocestoides corti]|uniref:Uncharacterized protein n=1 Tax=Mesocestoides corti TaxID=53468 RepID=A0A0R3U2S1_MESCO|nr:unnamed protein product [Mesocestoides corti]